MAYAASRLRGVSIRLRGVRGPADAAARDVPGWDRFARWPVSAARLALLALVLSVIAAALVPIHGRIHKPRPGISAQQAHKETMAAVRKRDADLALYDRVIARIRGGEGYYTFIVAEQRASRYPVQPGAAVRLPTLAYLEARLGPVGQRAAVLALVAAVLLAWWRRLGEERVGTTQRLAAMALLGFGVSRTLDPFYLVLHELWAGLLIALALGLHRPGRWHAALAAAALALAIRELALPFVLLMAAFALVRRDWRQGAAWTLLAAAFAIALTLHFHAIAPHVLPGDRVSAPWLALRGLSGWLSDVVLSSNLRRLYRPLAGVIVILAMAGWAGWRGAAGLFGFWLMLGYGVFFMIAGRWENFYWGWTVAPVLFIGLAFAPGALLSLVRAAFAPRAIAPSPAL